MLVLLERDRKEREAEAKFSVPPVSLNMFELIFLNDNQLVLLF